MNTITAIYQTLQQKQSSVQLSLINTRVMLETGVNLRHISAEQDRDQTTVAKVTAALRGMGVAA